MSAVAASSTAMSAVAASSTALGSIAKQTNTSTLSKWLTEVNKSQTLISAIASTLKSASNFTNSYNGGHDGVSGADTYFASKSVIGLLACGYYTSGSSSSQKVNMTLNGTTIFSGKSSNYRPTTGNSGTDGIAIRDCKFTETGDGYLGISVYTVK